MVYNFRQKLQKDKISKFPENLYISEGLIKSFDYDDIIKLLNNIFNKYDITFDYNLDSFSLKIFIKRIDLNNSKDFVQKIKKLFNIAGYVVTNYEISNIIRGNGFPNNYILYSDYDTLTLELNKKFDTEMKGIPIYLYHVTEEKYIEKIKKNGLYPKSLNKIENHPDRVYLFNNIDSAKYYCNELKERYNITNFIILKIDTRLTNKLILRYDPKFGGENSDFGAFYTDNHFSTYSIIKYIK